MPLALTKQPTMKRSKRPISTPTIRPSKKPVKRPTKKPTRSPTARHLIYYGGPVIANVKIVTIWWGSNVLHTTQIENFYRAITNSSWFEILSQYSTSSRTIGAGIWMQSYNFSNAPGGIVSDKQIEASLKSFISRGYVPSADRNTYYVIHFAPGTVIASGTVESCVNFCAYHRAIQSNMVGFPYILLYGAIPDFSGDCMSTCRTDTNVFKNTCAIASRALAGTVTNPFDIFSIDHRSLPTAWLSSGGEIGSVGLCSGSTGTSTGNDGVEYTVMKLWSNKDKTCLANASPMYTPTAIPTLHPSMSPIP